MTGDRRRAAPNGRESRPNRGRTGPGATVPVAAGSLALLGAVWGLQAPVAAAASSGGVAVLAPPGDTAAQALSSGTATTRFTVVLPPDAACAGDTAHDGYHVYSYLVKSGTDLDTVHFIEQPSEGYGLFDTAHEYYGPANTALNTGEVVEIPNDFAWGSMLTGGGGTVPPSALLYGGASGVWEAGVLCADTDGVPTNEWNTQITFRAGGAGSDGVTWSAAPEAYPFSSVPTAAASTPPTTTASAVPAVTSSPAHPTASTAPAATAGSPPSGRRVADIPTPATAITSPGEPDGLLIGLLVAAIVVILGAISLVTGRAVLARRRSSVTPVGGSDGGGGTAGEGTRP